MTQEKTSYYRFGLSLDLPIFVKFESPEYKDKFHKILEECLFIPIKEEDFKKSLKSKNLRVLNIENLKAGLESRLAELSYSGRIGKESVSSYKNYFLYRYQRQALLMYSFKSQEWKLGISENFFSDPFGMRLVINRFLGLSLSPFSCIGLWGRVVDKKIIVSGPLKSEAHAVIIHVEDGLYLSAQEKGAKLGKINDLFSIFHYEPQLREERRMNRDELYGFIMARCTYFHEQGIELGMRQLIYNLSRASIGIRTPESFADQSENADKLLSSDVNPSMFKA